MSNGQKTLATAGIILGALILIGVLRGVGLDGDLEITILDILALVAIGVVWQKKRV